MRGKGDLLVFSLSHIPWAPWSLSCPCPGGSLARKTGNDNPLQIQVALLVVAAFLGDQSPRKAPCWGLSRKDNVCTRFATEINLRFRPSTILSPMFPSLHLQGFSPCFANALEVDKRRSFSFSGGIVRIWIANDVAKTTFYIFDVQIFRGFSWSSLLPGLESQEWN